MRGRAGLLGFSAILLLAAVVRIPAMFSDFWLDEIWALTDTAPLRSWTGVFTELTSSNNHHLYGLYLYALGGDLPWEVYRLPALVAGVLTVFFAWLVGRAHGTLEAAATATLLAASYPLIHYSSEARGYSFVVLFSVAGFYALRCFRERPSWLAAAGFWVCAILGMLSHMTYGEFLVAAGLWQSVTAWRRDRRAAVPALLKLFGVPLVAGIVFLVGIARTMNVSGGGTSSPLSVLVETLSCAGGGPWAGPLAYVAAAAFVAVIVLAVVNLRRQGDEYWSFYALLALAWPALFLGVIRPDIVYLRYLLIPVTFGLMVAGTLLGARVRRGGRARVVALCALALWGVGNGANTSRLIRVGRGGYLAAVRTMAAASGPTVSVSSDHDFRNGTVLAFYAPAIRPQVLEYFREADTPSDGTQWFVTHSLDDATAVSETMADRLGNAFRLVRSFPCTELSGMSWHLYERAVPGVRGPRILSPKGLERLRLPSHTPRLRSGVVLPGRGRERVPEP